jgi:hypothetical protein
MYFLFFCSLDYDNGADYLCGSSNVHKELFLFFWRDKDWRG